MDWRKWEHDEGLEHATLTCNQFEDLKSIE